MSELHPRMQEIKNWLFSLEWDGRCRVEPVAGSLGLKADVFMGWLTGVAEKVMYRNCHTSQKTLAIFAPARKGKTEFLKWLALRDSVYSWYINLTDCAEDENMYRWLAESLIVEVDTGRFSEWERVNRCLTYSYMPKYRRTLKTIYPLGTAVVVGHQQPKKNWINPDMYIVADLECVSPRYRNYNVDITQLWAQAAHNAFPF